MCVVDIVCHSVTYKCDAKLSSNMNDKFLDSSSLLSLCFECTATANEKLKLLLSFAVGGLLGDVFLHLLPEAWAHVDKCMYADCRINKIMQYCVSCVPACDQCTPSVLMAVFPGEPGLANSAANFFSLDLLQKRIFSY